jgi:hypothetical protein
MSDEKDIDNALARLKAFRATWNADDVIDEQSGLTAGDLDLAIERIAETKDYVMVPYVEDFTKL